MARNADHLRGLTVCLDNRGGSEDLVKDVGNLCPGALIYGYSFCVKWTSEEVGQEPPEIVATWHLQDASIKVPSCGCKTTSLAHDLPGLAYPAFAKLVAHPGSKVCLVITYGNCRVSP